MGLVMLVSGRGKDGQRAIGPSVLEMCTSSSSIPFPAPYGIFPDHTALPSALLFSMRKARIVLILQGEKHPLPEMRANPPSSHSTPRLLLSLVLSPSFSMF